MMQTTAVAAPHPHQRRSRETMQRLVEAASRLLEKRNWVDVSVADLVREARSSVGSFYHLFGDKDGLLDYLDEQYAQQMLSFVDGFSRRCERGASSLEEAVEVLLRELAAFHRARRGTIRALVLRARRRREPSFDERTRRMNAALPVLLQFLLAHGHEIRHPQPRRACFLAFSFSFSALRERILFPETIEDPAAAGDDELVRELTRSMLAYLCWSPKEGRDS